MRRQLGEHIGDGESSCIGVGEDTGDERAQAAGAFLRRSGFGGAGRADERSDAATRFEHASAFKIGVDAGDGVGVHAQVDSELPDGRKLISGLQTTRGDGGAQSALELRVNRGAVARVNRNDAHAVILMY
jgi:hypothetical protein